MENIVLFIESELTIRFGFLFLVFLLIAAFLFWQKKSSTQRSIDMKNIPGAEYIEINALIAQIKKARAEGNCSIHSPHLVITPDGCLLGCRVANDFVIALPEPHLFLKAEDCDSEAKKYHCSMMHINEYKRVSHLSSDIRECFKSAGVEFSGSYWFCANIYCSNRNEYIDFDCNSEKGKFYEHSLTFPSWKSGFICRFS